MAKETSVSIPQRTRLVIHQRAKSYLVICNHDHAFWEFELYSTTRCGQDLSSHGLVTADTNRSWTPNMGHDGNGECKGLFCRGHEGIKPLAVDKIQRCTYELSNDNSIVVDVC